MDKEAVAAHQGIRSSDGFGHWCHLCLQAGSFHHPGLVAPFGFLNELGQPAGVRVWGVEREPKIRE